MRWRTGEEDASTMTSDVSSSESSTLNLGSSLSFIVGKGLLVSASLNTSPVGDVIGVDRCSFGIEGTGGGKAWNKDDDVWLWVGVVGAEGDEASAR